jgi:hypothetical protein
VHYGLHWPGPNPSRPAHGLAAHCLEQGSSIPHGRWWHRPILAVGGKTSAGGGQEGCQQGGDSIWGGGAVGDSPRKALHGREGIRSGWQLCRRPLKAPESEVTVEGNSRDGAPFRGGERMRWRFEFAAQDGGAGCAARWRHLVFRRRRHYASAGGWR